MDARGSRRRLLLAAVLVAAAVAGHAEGHGPQAEGVRARRPMGPVDLLGVESLGPPVVSPDGGRLLFTRSRPDWDRDRGVRHIWRVRADGAGLRQMTNGPTSESDPSWSPDGSRIAFRADRGEGEDSRTQIFVMPVDGGEAVQLTHHATAVGEYAWSPDGSRIYFLAEDAKGEEELARERAAGSAYRYPRNWKHRHLWWVDVETGQEHRLTEGEWSVWDFAVSPDGRRIVYSRGPTPLLDDVESLDLHLLDLETGESRELPGFEGVPENDPRLSPDGRWVAFTADADGAGDFYYEANLFVVPADGAFPPRILLPEQRGEVEWYRWAGDAGTLLAQINLGVHSELFRIELTGSGPEVTASATQLTGAGTAPPSASVEGFDVAGDGTVAFLLKAPDNPGDLWISPLEPFAPERVTELHADLRERFALPRAEVVRWSAPDGVEVEGILWHPTGGEDAPPHPLIVQIHGGPASSYQVTFSSWGNYVPVLAGMGYAVLQPNYRGGVGYGDAFLRDMVGGYFNHADDDVLAGVDALIERGLADPERLGLMGWSAGGHMTNWLVTQTDRFKAACSGAGASNWTSMYAQSDVRIYRTPWFGGTPWQRDAPLDAYLTNSPVFYAHRATTPTLILVGEKDARVPMAQSVEMYRALHHSGVATELVVFPDEPHGLRQLKHRLHKINVELEWFERHLMGREYRYAEPPEDSA